MNIINSNFEIIEQAPGIQGIKKQIERAGRTCYKSEDKITDNSCEEFVTRMINSGHGAMLEHGTVYLKIPINIDVAGDFLDAINTWTRCKLVKSDPNWWAVTTNYRVLVENNMLDYLQYLCKPTEYHEKRITVKFICDRGVSHKQFVA